MRVTATKLRQNVYAILDEVLEKGTPVEIERKWKILKIVQEKTKTIWDRMAGLPEIIVGDPEEFKNYKFDWEKEWREPENLRKLEIAARKRKAQRKRS